MPENDCEVVAERPNPLAFEEQVTDSVHLGAVYETEQEQVFFPTFEGQVTT